MASVSSSKGVHSLTEGSPFKVIFLLALPMIFSNIFQQLYNVIDTLLVGKLVGQHALSAVGSASSLVFVFIQLSTGFALGGSVVISQYFGAGLKGKIRSCTTTLTIFCVIVATVSTVVVWLFAEPLLTLVNTPAEDLVMAVDYLKFYFLGCIPIFIYNSLNSVYLALGNSCKPLRFLIVSSVVNVGLDLLFIGVFEWGVAGAAGATAISQLIAAVLALIDIPRFLKDFVPDAGSRLFDAKLLGTMLRFAVPNALQSSIVSIGSVIVQATINTFGTAVIAGSAAAAKVVNLASTVSINYSNAYSNYVGQNMGAGRTDRIKPGLFGSCVVGGVASLIMTVLFELFPRQIISWFVDLSEENVEAVIDVGADYLMVIGAFLAVFAVFMITKSTFKGAGDMSWFIFVTLLSFAIRLVLTLTLASVWGVGIIWWAICIGWVASLIVTMARYFQGGWKNKTIVKAGAGGEEVGEGREH